MASERQISANRRNATLSTGPITVAGKTRSAQNAIVHGLTANSTLVPGEDIEKFNELLRQLIEEYRPIGAREEMLVERAANLIWRLRRVPAFEAALFSQCIDISENLNYMMERPGVKALGNYKSENDGGLAAVLKSLLRHDMLGKLNRYETSLQKQLTESLRELQANLDRRARSSANDK